jgi:archaemetzincin
MLSPTRVTSKALLMALLPGAILLLSAMAVHFRPPTRAQQLAALGPTSTLPGALRRALEPWDDFQPMPEPEPSDWLANHAEAGQTFEQFIRSQPNRPDQRRSKLYLQPLGTFDEHDGVSLDQLRRFATAFFMMDVVVLPASHGGQRRITSRRNPWTGQVQLLTTDILNLLAARLPKDAFALLGVTMTDLYPEPSWNFVFGQASLRERVGVYSFARYDPRFYGGVPTADWHKLILRRSCKVLAHEACHMFGIEHCIWFRCLMNGSNHLAEADARPLYLCPVDLRKLQWSVGFDVAQRYRRLRDFEKQEGFGEEVLWLDKRIRFIAPNDRNMDRR